MSPAAPKRTCSRPRSFYRRGPNSRRAGPSRSKLSVRPKQATRPTKRLLPAVVGERLVRLGHPVRVVLLLDRTSLTAAGSEQLSCKAVGHVLL